MTDSIFFSSTLLQWYSHHRRELPWRDIADPYKIWISEIILQQTRVAQGLEYYNRFVARFPDVTTLAAATEEDVLRYWQGLGYYSRARNLHAAAKQVVQNFGGRFPERYEDVLVLKGIGSYTAAAICSFAYGQPYAVLDGNVYRVLSRVFGADLPIDSTRGKKYFERLAQELLPASCAADYNQAVMDFGAMQCVPVNPGCDGCCMAASCEALRQKKVHLLPVKAKKTRSLDRFFNYFFIRQGRFTYLSKRDGNDIWKNLYEFPLIETDTAIELEELLQLPEATGLLSEFGKITVEKTINPTKHVLSHRVIYAKCYVVSVDTEYEPTGSVIKINTSDMDNYPVSRLMEKILAAL